KSKKGIHVGYEQNGLKIWDVESRKFIVARDVIVDETNMKNSRTVEQNFNFVEECTECDQLDILKEMEDGIDVSKHMESDQQCILNKSKESAEENFRNESTEEKSKMQILDIQPSCETSLEEEAISVEHQLPDSPQKEKETEIRRSERLKGKPQTSYRFLN
ncbi:hypothetical protein KR059_003716, partial [Drosophila kikkawai]